ncbi:hypothetical protein ACRALDRAFT_1074057 [Sodiomyces alcalophilus JCM 7366]|uniref:uncharacterized protein n=1 Tax=Sodiomyces alcalophilus JCM 7366 TaxID=591952 RepID=UPI0039B5439E
MTNYDELAEADADEEHKVWIRAVFDASAEIVDFVDARLNGGGTARYNGFFKGSFNFSYHIGFGGRRPSVLIRFAMPGESVTSWRDEKVANEAQIIEYLHEHTSIPLPYIHCWGLTKESPRQLGPFLIMDFIPGLPLSTFLSRPVSNKYDPLVLNPDIDNTTLDQVFGQIADYMLQLSRLSFPRIGAISRAGSGLGTWTVTGRPLTFNMNLLATVTGYPVDQFPTEPINRASDFFEEIARQHLLHLETQRNLAVSEADAEKRFVARHRFRQLIPKFCADEANAGPFLLFCDDLQPANMLIDPHTLRITAVLDFEFTNSMPAQFAHDPPWWLLLRSPGVWIEDHGMDDFLASYVPRMEQFLRALENVEAKSPLEGREPRLSTRMRDSWESGRFWFNYAARRCLDVDTVYWDALHDRGDGDGLSLLDPATRAQAGAVARTKMEQLRSYKKEYAARFSEEASR